MKRLSDTSPDAQRVLTRIYRAMLPEQKLRLQAADSRLARALHEAGVLEREPGASRAELRESWNALTLGATFWNSIKRDEAVASDLDNIAVLREVLFVLERLKIAYAVGGSWASSVYGVPRMSQGADVSVEPFPEKAAELASAFGEGYYISLEAVTQALEERSTFNIIHFASGFKVDIFVLGDEPFARSMMKRRKLLGVPGSSEDSFVIVSAEDIVLLKLRWYRLGNEISELQWTDVLGVLRSQAEHLDREYLAHWARELRVNDLLEQALADVES